MSARAVMIVFALAGTAHADMCRDHDGVIDIGPVGRDVPSLVLFTLNAWSGAAFPDVVVWSDGRAVTPDGRVGKLGDDEAARFVRGIADRLRTAPRRASVAMMSDAPSLILAARDGDGWRVARVYGMNLSKEDRTVRTGPRMFAQAVSKVLSIATTDTSTYRGSDYAGAATIGRLLECEDNLRF